MIIYKITNTINNKIYVGKTKKSLETRWKEHCYKAFHEKRDYHFLQAIRKYGPDCWSMDIIEEVENDISNEREKYWISFYNSFDSECGYNSTIGGDGLIEMSNEARQKLSKSLMGRVPWNKGKTGYKSVPCSEEKKRKIGESQRGIHKSKHSDEEKRNKSIRQTGKKRGKYNASEDNYINNGKHSKDSKWCYNLLTGKSMRIKGVSALPENCAWGRNK